MWCLAYFEGRGQYMWCFACFEGRGQCMWCFAYFEGRGHACGALRTLCGGGMHVVLCVL